MLLFILIAWGSNFSYMETGAIENEDSLANSETDEFVPRSPVPLPDVSTCRPILVQLGFALSKKEKKGKVLRS